MSLDLQRTIAHYLGGSVSELHSFKDDIAWNAAGNPYPYVLISEISSTRRGLGAGAWDGLNDEPEPRRVKLIKARFVLRFTVRAVSTQTSSGSWIAAEIIDRIAELFLLLSRDGGVDLPIPDSDPAATLHIERISYQGSMDLSPIETGEPFVYQRSVSFAFLTHRVYGGETVTDSFDSLLIEKE